MRNFVSSKLAKLSTLFFKMFSNRNAKVRSSTDREESWSGIRQEKLSETHEESVSGHKKANETHLLGETLKGGSSAVPISRRSWKP